MRKKVLFLCTLYIASLSLILTGCNKNEPEQPAKVQTYHVSIQAGKGDANQQNGPRKALGLDGTTLTASWKTGEQVSVRNVTKSTDLTGYLVAQSNGVHTIISGDLTGTINAGDELLLRFLSPDYTNQQGTLAYIELHSDYAEATIHVASVTWGSITFVEGIANFENRQAIAKFTLMNEAKDAALAASDLKVEVDNNAYNIHVDPAASEIFVALPGFSDKTIKLTATVGSDTYTFTSPSVKTFVDGKYYVITVGMIQKVHGFSIDPTHQIKFSRGNLQYKASENKWRFAEHQYDYVGTYYTGHIFGTANYFNDPEPGTVYEGNVKCNNTDETTNQLSTNCWIDLFGWNTTNDPLKFSNAPKDYALVQSDFVDWGSKTIHDTRAGISYVPNTWRTLTDAEWKYIISDRPNAEQLCGLASITVPIPTGNVEVKGVILLPEDFVKPDEVIFHNITDPSNTYVMHPIANKGYQGADTWPNTFLLPNPLTVSNCYTEIENALASNNYMYNHNRYTLEQWNALEAAGAIFLPNCGIIWPVPNAPKYGEISYVALMYPSFYGGYWSSTLGPIETQPDLEYNRDAYYLLMRHEIGEIGFGSQPLTSGLSVRLVRDL